MITFTIFTLWYNQVFLFIKSVLKIYSLNILFIFIMKFNLKMKIFMRFKCNGPIGNEIRIFRICIACFPLVHSLKLYPLDGYLNTFSAFPYLIFVYPWDKRWLEELNLVLHAELWTSSCPNNCTSCHYFTKIPRHSWASWRRKNMKRF